jgi:hypothetical protein
MLVHESPRQYGYPNSLWTLSQLAEVSYSREKVSHETVRHALMKRGLNWRQAREHISRPDSQYEQKNEGVTD